MSCKGISRLSEASLCGALALALGCGRSTPAAPTIAESAPISPVTNGLKIWSISPATGSTAGRTPLLIHGDGFEPGAIVTLDGAATAVTVLSSTTITATSPVHPAGTVDVVVTNPGGVSGRLTKGYTFAPVIEGTQPSITAVSPNTGTVGGGGFITITGSGFQPGAIVSLDHTALRTYAFGSSSTIINAQASAHASGSVDVIVVNPDGHSATLTAGYRYAAPDTLDFNGQWKGEADDLRDSHSGTEIRFTVEKNGLVSVTCNGGVEVTIATPASISNDEFSFFVDGQPLVSGRFVSADMAVGKINVPPCGLTWGARKQR